MADRRYHVAFNSVGRYIGMRMRQVHLSMHTEDIKAFSKRIRHCSVDGENDTKTISVDANLCKVFNNFISCKWYLNVVW